MEPNKHHHLLLEAIKNNPNATQRELAQDIGISLGKVNYCLKGLVEKGWIKAGNFKRSNNKLGYIYLLTPKGIEEKAKLTKNYLARKLVEYEELEAEIKALKEQVEQ
jgi:EPS-associated MarR family transcriptional regulator